MPFAYSESARTVREALGAVLRQRREALHRTLTEVATEAAVSPAHLSEVERGRKEVSTERLLAVAHALGVRPADHVQPAPEDSTADRFFSPRTRRQCREFAGAPEQGTKEVEE